MVKHMGIAKEYLLAISDDDRAAAFPDWQGTDAELRQAIEDDPRVVFCSCNCRKDASGACTGETSKAQGE